MKNKFLAVFLTLIMSTTPAYSGLTANSLGLDGLEIQGEFLWWQGKGDSFYTSIAETAEVAFPEVTTTSYAYWNFGYSPGFRVGFSYQPCDWNNGLSFYSTFTHFRSTDSQSIDVVGTDETTFEIQTIHRFFAITDGEIFEYTGSADFLYNRADVGFAKVYNPYGSLSIIPKVAFTYVHTRLSIYENILDDDEDDPALLDLLATKDSFSGYGATIGFDTIYDFDCCSGLALFSSLSLSGVWGPFNFSLSEEFNSDGVLVATFEEDQSPAVGRWISDIQVGLQYGTTVGSCYQFVARLGWEFLYLADQVDFYRSRDPSSMKINGLTLGFALGF